MTLTGALMVCGTASDVGKSQVVTGLCRLLARMDVRVAPFKGQNMSLNSYVTESGHEIGRSQAHQAFASRVAPEVDMNPVLLKPTDDRTSQVIVRGRPLGHQDAMAYQAAKKEHLATVLCSLESLRDRFEVVILEGAGSPAETNLMSHDLVNLGLAVAADVPAILVADIERGGAFAMLYGTLALLPDECRERIGGFVINKFRGDRQILQPAIDDLERRSGLPCLGVLPHVGHLGLDAEDSLALGRRPALATGTAPVDVLDVAVCRFPRLSNFTDVDALMIESGVDIRFVEHPAALGDPDLVVLPGSKCTVDDLGWLRTVGLDEALVRARGRKSAVIGICAGYQMLGEWIYDDVESSAGEVRGLAWLPMTTTFDCDKLTRQRRGSTGGLAMSGYEIRHGRPSLDASTQPWIALDDAYGCESEGAADGEQGLWGTSLHGLFEEDGFRTAFLTEVAARRRKQFEPAGVSFAAARDEQIERVADLLEAHLDLDRLFDLVATSQAR